MTHGGSTTAPVPPGPGVQPPFVAPPTDGMRQRRWLAFGLAAATVLLCCAGSVVGFGALVVLGNQAIIDQSRAAVTEYLTAIQQERYADAYGMLCEDRRAVESQRQFERAREEEPKISSFTVGEPVLGSDGEMRVPAQLRYVGGGSRSLRYLLKQDRTTGEFKVCGTEV